LENSRGQLIIWHLQRSSSFIGAKCFFVNRLANWFLLYFFLFCV
jgi:hypothetical protein